MRYYLYPQMEEGIERGLSDRKNKKEEQFVKTDKERRVFFLYSMEQYKKEEVESSSFLCDFYFV